MFLRARGQVPIFEVFTFPGGPVWVVCGPWDQGRECQSFWPCRILQFFWGPFWPCEAASFTQLPFSASGCVSEGSAFAVWACLVHDPGLAQPVLHSAPGDPVALNLCNVFGSHCPSCGWGGRRYPISSRDGVHQCVAPSPRDRRRSVGSVCSATPEFEGSRRCLGFSSPPRPPPQRGIWFARSNGLVARSCLPVEWPSGSVFDHNQKAPAAFRHSGACLSYGYANTRQFRFRVSGFP